eukprot:3635842-Rhodomonas_salina.3
MLFRPPPHITPSSLVHRCRRPVFHLQSYIAVLRLRVSAQRTRTLHDNGAIRALERVERVQTQPRLHIEPLHFISIAESGD